MTPIGSVRVATCVVAAALVGAAAATLPAEARAEDGTASSPGAATSMPAIDGAALAGEASAAVETAVSEVLDGTQATDTSSTVQAGNPPSATDDGTAASVPSPTTAAPDVPPATIPDTTVDSADTSGDIAATEPISQAPAPQPTSSAAQTPSSTAESTPSAVQSLPGNVNVSVRIGSAGDNGPVTQLNVAAAASPVAIPTAPVPPATSGAKSGEQPTAAVSAPAPATAPTSREDDGTWTWQWNCLSTPDLIAISPSGSATRSIPSSWTWIWNCGSNSGQYRDATSTQYQPSNVNVSIRISSPGNDGPVTQSNVAAALGVAAAVSAVGAAVGSSTVPALPAPQPEAAPTLPGITVLPGLPSLPELVATAGTVLTIGDVIGAAVAPSDVSVLEPVELPFVLPPFRGGEPTEPSDPGMALPRVGLPGSASWLAPMIQPGTPFVSGAVLAEGTAGGRSGSEPSAGAHGRQKPTLRWKAPPPPQPLPASVSSGTSAAPATGGGSSSGGIPIFLALPFLAAMLDLARRVVLDGTAVPSGHRSRMSDDPG